MKQAVFSLKNYSVVNVMLDLENIPPQCIFDLKIEPSGIYFQRERQYVLNLVFKASYKKENTDFEVINIKLKAVFSFGDMVQADNIPPYFMRTALLSFPLCTCLCKYYNITGKRSSDNDTHTECIVVGT